MADDVTIRVPVPVLREASHSVRHQLTRVQGRMNKEREAWRMRDHVKKVARLRAFLEAIEAQVGDIKYRGPDQP